MNAVVSFFEAFIGVFNKGGENLVTLVTGILPTLACLMTFILAIVKFIGEERVEKFAQKASKYTLLRYTLIPVLAFFVFTNPMNYTIGRFLPEKYKGAFFDASCAMAHPLTGLFPNCNSSELFIWLGVANGITALGKSTTPLAVRYLIAGLIIGLLRGILTEKLWLVYAKKNNVEDYDSNEVVLEG